MDSSTIFAAVILVIFIYPIAYFVAYPAGRYIYNPKDKKHWRRMRYWMFKQNDKFAQWVLQTAKDNFRMHIVPSGVRWGIEGFLFALGLYLLSLPFGRGAVVSWASIISGSLVIIFGLSLGIHFLRHQNRDYASRQQRKQLSRMDEGIKELVRIQKDIYQPKCRDFGQINKKIVEDLRKIRDGTYGQNKDGEEK